MKNYTPGPWRAHTLPDGSHHVVADHWGASIAVTMYPESGSEGREANARLIAAAPDMLKVLQAIQYRAAKNDPLSTAWLDAICTEVINLAKGE